MKRIDKEKINNQRGWPESSPRLIKITLIYRAGFTPLFDALRSITFTVGSDDGDDDCIDTFENVWTESSVCSFNYTPVEEKKIPSRLDFNSIIKRPPNDNDESNELENKEDFSCLSIEQCLIRQQRRERRQRTSARSSFFSSYSLNSFVMGGTSETRSLSLSRCVHFDLSSIIRAWNMTWLAFAWCESVAS